ncbi:MAG: hypothetical protein CSA18_02755 [Deltaproteobacteria bacterium]|nr:MAG: hypothetical protein CSA18_02755 [Deltaproteobacteria bacterium]
MSDINLVLVDFGGVIAQEGFKAGIRYIAEKHGFDTDKFMKTAFELVYGCGFTTGKNDSDGFWDRLKQITALNLDNDTLTSIILERFVVREELLLIIEKISEKNIKTAVLSDQTNWLDELDKKYDFFKYFDKIFNSYHLGITKKDPEIFDRVIAEMDEKPENTLFIDDYMPHLERAEQKKIKTILFKNMEDFRQDIVKYFEWLDF